MKIVALVGSPRVNGNTSYLTDEALKEAAKFGIETEKIILDQYRINPCQAHSDCRDATTCYRDDDMASVLATVYDADGIIIASPVYYYNVPAQLKAFIDRNIFRYRHRHKMNAKSAGIIVIAGGEGVEETANAIVQYIRISSTIPASNILQMHGMTGSTGDIKSNVTVVKQARELGQKMAKELLES